MERRQQMAITEAISDRTPRPLMAPVLTFDLAREVDALRREGAWHEHGHNARTLVKHSEFRLVLIVFAQGHSIHEQSIEERIVLQTLKGRLRVHVPTENVELGPVQMLALDRDLSFGLEALEDSELLLWVGWSRD